MMELASAIPLGGHDYSTAVGKLVFMAPWTPDNPTTIHTSRQSHNRGHVRSETVDTNLKGTQHTSLRLEPRGGSKGLLELVGRIDSDWAGDSATRQSVTGYHCNVQGVTMCNRSLKQTAISPSSCEAEFYVSSACAGELLGLADLFKELHHNLPVSSRDGFRSATTHSTAQRTRRTQAYRKTMPWLYNSGYEKKRLSVGRVDTTNNTAGLFTKHLDGPRTQSFARKLGLRILEGTNDVWEL